MLSDLVNPFVLAADLDDGESVVTVNRQCHVMLTGISTHCRVFCAPLRATLVLFAASSKAAPAKKAATGSGAKPKAKPAAKKATPKRKGKGEREPYRNVPQCWACPCLHTCV
jgi:hypothetical protein